MPSSSHVKPLSVVHTMCDYGQLHAGSISPDKIEALRCLCHSTSPNAIHVDPNILPPEVRAILQQSHLDRPMLQVKCMDGYVFITPEHKILSILKDDAMKAPTTYAKGKGALVRVRKCNSNVSRMLDGCANTPANPYPTLFYSIVHPTSSDDSDDEDDNNHHQPKQQQQYKSFTLVHHDGITGPDEISRYTRIDDMIAKLAAAIPLQSEPRVIMQAPRLGTLFGRCLNGKDADLVKQTFLSLATQAGSDMYGVPVKISDELAKLLMVSPNDPKGPIYIGRLLDGIIGWRLRENGSKSFLFVANCEEFHDKQPLKLKKTQLHLYGMHYDSQSPEAPRIFVKVLDANSSNCEDNNDAEGYCKFGTPPISLSNTTVQMVLNIVDFKVRNFGRDFVGGQKYTSWCMKKAAQDLHDPEVHPFQRNVARAILVAAGGGGGLCDADEQPRKSSKSKKQAAGSKRQSNFMFAAAACSNSNDDHEALKYCNFAPSSSMPYDNNQSYYKCFY